LPPHPASAKQRIRQSASWESFLLFTIWSASV
jgi:hypothetical protein